MRPLETTAMLAAFEGRGPGTDAERRAAHRVAAELTGERHRVTIEPFWCRPNWALAHAWHVALALAGSLVSVSRPTVGAAMLGAAMISVLADDLIGVSPGRRLTPERASQNVVSRPQQATPDAIDKTKLIVTANYDAGRTGLVYRDTLRGPAGWLRRLTGPLALGWLGCTTVAITWSLTVAVIRSTEHHPSHALGVIQLPPTVALVLALALLLEASAAPYGPAANDNASGSAVAVAVLRALESSPPENLALELVLAGAGEGGGIGMRRYLRTRRHELARARTVVLGVAPCGSGHVHYWVSDGRLIPLGYARPLRALCSGIGRAGPHRGRGASPALTARAGGLPAIAIGCLDSRGLPPRSHRPTDVKEAIDETALGRALEYALLLVDEINAVLAPAEPSATPA